MGFFESQNFARSKANTGLCQNCIEVEPLGKRYAFLLTLCAKRITLGAFNTLGQSEAKSIRLEVGPQIGPHNQWYHLVRSCSHEIGQMKGRSKRGVISHCTRQKSTESSLSMQSLELNLPVV